MKETKVRECMHFYPRLLNIVFTGKDIIMLTHKRLDYTQLFFNIFFKFFCVNKGNKNLKSPPVSIKKNFKIL